MYEPHARLRRAGTVLATSAGVTDTEQISLAGLAAGTYFVKVYGFAGATNPGYSLAVSGPAGTGADRYEPNDSAAAPTRINAFAVKPATT